MTANTPGRIQRKTVTENAITVDFSPVDQLPRRSCSRSSMLALSAAPAFTLFPALPSTKKTAMSMMTTVGTPNSIHLKNGNSVPVSCRMNPRPMTLGGVPMGVASPPTEAAKDVISISAVA